MSDEQDVRVIDFFGREFRVNAPEDYETAVLDFAEAAEAESSSLAAAAAVKRVLRAGVHAEDWDAFWSHARANKAQVKRDLMPIVVQMVTGQAGRPTGRPSDSSDGPPSTPESSEVASYSRVVAAAEARGRPDIAEMVLLANAAAGSPA